MREIRTEAEIDAPPEIVWNVLSDLPSYGEWNPFITDASGELSDGATIRIRVEPTASRPVKMKATVMALEPERLVQWTGGPPLPRLFKGRHTMALYPLDGDRTRFVNRERMTGLLVRFVVPTDVWRDYEAMNRALAERAERLYADQGART
jgi:hypothetical protein